MNGYENVSIAAAVLLEVETSEPRLNASNASGAKYTSTCPSAVVISTPGNASSPALGAASNSASTEPIALWSVIATTSSARNRAASTIPSTVIAVSPTSRDTPKL